MFYIGSEDFNMRSLPRGSSCTISSKLRGFFSCCNNLSYNCTGRFGMFIIYVSWNQYLNIILDRFYRNSNHCSINFFDLAPKYASLMIGFANGIACIAGLISPTITGFIVKNRVNNAALRDLKLFDSHCFLLDYPSWNLNGRSCFISPPA